MYDSSVKCARRVGGGGLLCVSGADRNGAHIVDFTVVHPKARHCSGKQKKCDFLIGFQNLNADTKRIGEDATGETNRQIRRLRDSNPSVDVPDQLRQKMERTRLNFILLTRAIPGMVPTGIVPMFWISQLSTPRRGEFVYCAAEHVAPVKHIVITESHFSQTSFGS